MVDLNNNKNQENNIIDLANSIIINLLKKLEIKDYTKYLVSEKDLDDGIIIKNINIDSNGNQEVDNKSDNVLKEDLNKNKNYNIDKSVNLQDIVNKQRKENDCENNVTVLNIKSKLLKEFKDLQKEEEYKKIKEFKKILLDDIVKELSSYSEKHYTISLDESKRHVVFLKLEYEILYDVLLKYSYIIQEVADELKKTYDFPELYINFQSNENKNILLNIYIYLD